MFGPVTSFADGVTTAGSLLADLHADSQPVENAVGRNQPDWAAAPRNIGCPAQC